MGCGSSKSSAVIRERPGSYKDFDHAGTGTAKANIQERLLKSLDAAHHEVPLLAESNTACVHMPPCDLSDEEVSTTDCITCVHMPPCDLSDEEVSTTDCITANIEIKTQLVSDNALGTDTFQTTQHSLHNLGKQESTQLSTDKELVYRNNAFTTSVATTAPSSACNLNSVESTASIREIGTFIRSIKQACKLTSNEKLVEMAPFVDSLEFDRSFYSFTQSDLLFKVVSGMKRLHTLNLSGSQMGPIAFRFIVSTLKHNTTIKELDLSDNMANPECSALIGSLVATNSTLDVLNISGNRLGKDALSRYLGPALFGNSNLKSLNISNCGATDLHCLFESVRNSNCSSLTSLVTADNAIHNDHQFAVDVSLCLEKPDCKLENFDISNTCLSSDAMGILIGAISKNTSVRSLWLGKNLIKNLKMLCLMLYNVWGHSNMTLFSMMKTNVEDSTLCDFTDHEIKAASDQATSQLRHLNVADCALNDGVLQYLASQFDGTISNLEFLDVSRNDIGPVGIGAIYQLCNGNLKKLNVTQIQNPDGIVEVLSSRFSELAYIDFSKTKLSKDDVKSLLVHAMTHRTSLLLNGMKLSGYGILSGLHYFKTTLHLTELHLSVCQLKDDDMDPFCHILAQTSVSFPLQKLDVSVNRLTALFINNLFESLTKHSQHSLQIVNASDNVIDGSCLKSLSNLFNLSTHCSSLLSVNLSCNDISAGCLTEFLLGLKNQKFPLQHFDLSNQRESFIESDMEDLAKVLKQAFVSEQDAGNENDFVMDLRGNGSSEILDFSLIDSVAIKTDFVKKRNPGLTVRDVIEVSRGIQTHDVRDKLSKIYAVSVDVWKDIILKEAPAWALVTSDLSKAAFISHMPSTATSQRIQGMLEMDADCDIRDFFLVKDPISQQSVGSAWVLFQDSISLQRAIDWFYMMDMHTFLGLNLPSALCH